MSMPKKKSPSSPFGQASAGDPALFTAGNGWGYSGGRAAQVDNDVELPGAEPEEGGRCCGLIDTGILDI